MTSRVSSWAYDHLIRQEFHLIVEGKFDIEPYFSIVEAFFSKVIPEEECEKNKYVEVYAIRMLWRFVAHVLPCLTTDSVADEKKGLALKEGIRFLDVVLNLTTDTEMTDEVVRVIKPSLMKLKAEMVMLAIMMLVKKKSESRILFNRYKGSLSKYQQESMKCILHGLFDAKKILHPQLTYVKMIQNTLQKVLTSCDKTFICKVSNACSQYRRDDGRYQSLVDSLDSDVEVIDAVEGHEGESVVVNGQTIGSLSGESLHTGSDIRIEGLSTSSSVREGQNHLSTHAKQTSPIPSSDASLVSTSSFKGRPFELQNLSSPEKKEGFSGIQQDMPRVPPSHRNQPSTLQPVTTNVEFKAPKSPRKTYSRQPSKLPSVSFSGRSRASSVSSAAASSRYLSRVKNPFTLTQDAYIIMGMQKFATGSHRWKNIVRHFEFPEYRTAGHLKDRWRTLIGTGDVQIVNGEIRLSEKYRSVVSFLSSSGNHIDGRKKQHREITKCRAGREGGTSKKAGFQSVMRWIETAKGNSHRSPTKKDSSIISKEETKRKESSTPNFGNTFSSPPPPKLKGRNIDLECQVQQIERANKSDDDDVIIVAVEAPFSDRKSTSRDYVFGQNSFGKYMRINTCNKQFACSKGRKPKKAEDAGIEIEPSGSAKKSVLSSSKDKPENSDEAVLNNQSQLHHPKCDDQNAPMTLELLEALCGTEQTDTSELFKANMSSQQHKEGSSTITVSPKRMQALNEERKDQNTPSTLELMEVLCDEERNVIAPDHYNRTSEQLAPDAFHGVAGSSQSTPDLLLHHGNVHLAKNGDAVEKNADNTEHRPLDPVEIVRRTDHEGLRPVRSPSSESGEVEVLHSKAEASANAEENSQFTLNLLQNLDEESQQLIVEVESQGEASSKMGRAADDPCSSGHRVNENISRQKGAAQDGVVANELTCAQHIVATNTGNGRVSPILCKAVCSPCSSESSVFCLARPSSPSASEYMTPDEGVPEEMRLMQDSGNSDDEKERTLVQETTIVIKDADTPNNIEQWMDENPLAPTSQGSEYRLDAPILDNSESGLPAHEPHDSRPSNNSTSPRPDPQSVMITSQSPDDDSQQFITSGEEVPGSRNSDQGDAMLQHRQAETEELSDHNTPLTPPSDDMDVRDFCSSNFNRVPLLQLTRIEIQPGIYTSVPCFRECGSNEDTISASSGDGSKSPIADADNIITGQTCNGDSSSSDLAGAIADTASTMKSSNLMVRAHIASGNADSRDAEDLCRVTRSKSKMTGGDDDSTSAGRNLGIKRRIHGGGVATSENDASFVLRKSVRHARKMIKLRQKKRKFNLLSGGSPVKMTAEDKAFFFSGHATLSSGAE